MSSLASRRDLTTIDIEGGASPHRNRRTRRRHLRLGDAECTVAVYYVLCAAIFSYTLLWCDASTQHMVLRLLAAWLGLELCVFEARSYEWLPALCVWAAWLVIACAAKDGPAAIDVIPWPVASFASKLTNMIAALSVCVVAFYSCVQYHRRAHCRYNALLFAISVAVTAHGASQLGRISADRGDDSGGGTGAAVFAVVLYMSMTFAAQLSARSRIMYHVATSCADADYTLGIETAAFLVGTHIHTRAATAATATPSSSRRLDTALLPRGTSTLVQHLHSSARLSRTTQTVWLLALASYACVSTAASVFGLFLIAAQCSLYYMLQKEMRTLPAIL